MNEAKKTYAIDALLGEISARREDRGFMAELRRGLTPATEDQAWPHIVRFADKSFTDDTRRRIYVTVSALAATLAPGGLLRTEGFSSIGTVMRQLAKGEKGKDDDGLKTYEPKFRRLLNSADALDLCDLVVAVGRNAERKGIAVNCRVLFWDLWKWDDAEEREKIRVRWARDFYAVFEKKESEEAKEGANA